MIGEGSWCLNVEDEVLSVRDLVVYFLSYKKCEGDEKLFEGVLERF